MISVASLCDLCRGRLDAVLSNAGRHPGCGPPCEPITEAAGQQLVTVVTAALPTFPADDGRTP